LQLEAIVQATSKDKGLCKRHALSYGANVRGYYANNSTFKAKK